MGKTQQAKYMLLRAHINWRIPRDGETADIVKETPTHGFIGISNWATTA